MLDALIGVRDRPAGNRNYMYSLQTGSWSSLDYAESFASNFDQPYEEPFVSAVRSR